MEYFFSNQYANEEYLFRDLFIWKEEKYRKLQGSYPVIFVSFAGIKGDTYETVREGIIQVIIDLYAKYSFLLEGDFLNRQEKAYFDYINAGMSDAVASMALHRLAMCLKRYYDKKTIILLDEYDTPLQEAYLYGYWDKLASFIRSMFNFTFKTNPYLERGLMTGITRVSKESYNPGPDR
ncbi:MAG: AAA family ATPase [Eubacteriales bacterium]|nr:AAA family ATPase [Eubacteriales bacterium]